MLTDTWLSVPAHSLSLVYAYTRFLSIYFNCHAYGGNKWIRTTNLLRMKELHFQLCSISIVRGRWIRTNDDDVKDRCLRPLGDTPIIHECKLLKNIFCDTHKEKPPSFYARGLVFVFSFRLLGPQGTSPHSRCVATINRILKARNGLPLAWRWHIVSFWESW